MRGQSSQLEDEQLKQAKHVWEQLQECVAGPELYRIYEEKIMAQRVSWLIPAMTAIKESDSKYIVMIKKHKCLDPNEKSSTAI